MWIIDFLLLKMLFYVNNRQIPRLIFVRQSRTKNDMISAEHIFVCETYISAMCGHSE